MRSLPLILRRALLSAAALVAMASSAQAVVNNYGNLVGPNIMYLDVVETATQFPGPTPPAGLLGAPQLAGDNLVFNPLNFAGSATNGGVLLQDAQLTIDTIMTNSPLGQISKLVINEGGGFIVAGGPGAAIARASLIAAPVLVAQVNGGPAPISVTITPTLAFSNTPNGSVTVSTTANSIQFASAGGVGNGSWGITATYDIAAALAAAGYPANARVTKLGTLALDNQLIRTANPGENNFAYMDKKFFNITVTAIPEPSTILLGLMGGVGLLVGGRRLRKAKTA